MYRSQIWRTQVVDGFFGFKLEASVKVGWHAVCFAYSSSIAPPSDSGSLSVFMRWKKGSSWGFAWFWTVLDVLEQGADLRYWRKSHRTLSIKFAGVARVAVLDHSLASSFPFFRHVGCDHAISGTECCWTFKQTCRASKIHRLHTCKVFHGISYAVAQTWSQFRLPLCKRVIYSYNSSTPKQDFRMPATKSIPTAFPGIPYGTWILRCLGVSFWIFLFELCFGFILFLVCLLLQLMKRHQALYCFSCCSNVETQDEGECPLQLKHQFVSCSWFHSIRPSFIWLERRSTTELTICQWHAGVLADKSGKSPGKWTMTRLKI